jgi:hypothetical protein
MSKKPVIKDIDNTTFHCEKAETFKILGENFAEDVTVDLEETRHKKDHEWKPPHLKAHSNATPGQENGTEIVVTSTPRKKDGSKCDGRPVGDLTITVTNDQSRMASDPKSFDVTYTV